MNQLVDLVLSNKDFDVMLYLMEDALSSGDFGVHRGMLSPYFGGAGRPDAPRIIKGACYLLLAHCLRDNKVYERLSSTVYEEIKNGFVDTKYSKISRECYYNYELLYTTLAHSDDALEHLKGVACAYLNEMISFDVYREILENATNNVYDFKNMRRIKSYAEELKETKGENKTYFL